MLFTHLVIYVCAYFGLFTAIFFLLTYFENRKEMADPVVENEGFPFISIIIPVYNEEKIIKKTINSVLNLDYPKNRYEIIVVDDGSTDSTYEEVKSLRLKNIHVFRKENGGKGSAMNLGIKKAKGEFIVSLDADSVVSKGALKKMIGYFKDREIAAVTSSLNLYKPKSLLLKLQWVEFMLGIFLRKIFSLNEAIHVIPGPFSIYRKSFFKKHGGFDEHNLTEDTEIAMRIQAKGYKIRNSISANVYAKQPSSFKGILSQRLRWYYGFVKNSAHYKCLFPPKRWDSLALLILPAAFVSIVLVIIAAFVFFYLNLSYLKNYLIQLSVVNFDIIQSLFNIKLNYIIEIVRSFFTNPFIIFMFIGIILTFILVWLAKHESKDKRNMIGSFIFFILTYWLFFAFWWLSVLVWKGVFRRKIKWGPRYY